MPRSRRAIAVACIAVVLLATVFPLTGLSVDWCVVPATFVLLQPALPVSLRADSIPIGTRRGSPDVVRFRGPPAPFV